MNGLNCWIIKNPDNYPELLTVAFYRAEAIYKALNLDDPDYFCKGSKKAAWAKMKHKGFSCVKAQIIKR